MSDQELEHQAEVEPVWAHEPLWERGADLELLDVRHKDRVIELVVIPYEVDAVVEYEGRMCRETIARGSFDGIQRRANRVKANRDHQEQRTFGRAVSLHPNREEGLVAAVRCAQTPLGDETLELAADGCLEASAGFRPQPGGLKWLTRSAYTITKAWLGHISLVPDGAYGEHAPVLLVRRAPVVTPAAGAPHYPNREIVRAMLLADRVKSDPLYR